MEVRKCSKDDEELKLLMEVVIRGWPENIQDLPKCIRSYWSMKDFLSVEDGILIKGERIVIPLAMQQEILKKLHLSHQGVEKTRLRARTCVYWRGIDKDIEEITRDCDVCLKFCRKEQKQSMIPRDLPASPWQYLGTDLFEVDNHSYLILADYYSKMPFVRKISSESTRAVILKLKTLFGEHGIPEVLFSDGGPCFASAEFQSFSNDWGFKHVMSSPHYPQSNGFIERAIQTVKLIMKRSIKSGVDPELAYYVPALHRWTIRLVAQLRCYMEGRYVQIFL